MIDAADQPLEYTPNELAKLREMYAADLADQAKDRNNALYATVSEENEEPTRLVDEGDWVPVPNWMSILVMGICLILFCGAIYGCNKISAHYSWHPVSGERK